MTNRCPKCNAPLQENAQFCPHCMTVLAQKQVIENKKETIGGKKRIALICTALFLIASICASGIFAASYKAKHAPICSVEQFKEAAPLVSERRNADASWIPEGLIDIKEFQEEKIVQYTTDTYIGNAFFSLFFYNKGEEVYAYICDIAPKDIDSAENLLKCVAIATCNNYFKDIDDVFDNEKVYPKSNLDTPFRKGFTDLLLRTDKYNEDIENGAEISTRYIEMTDGEYHIIYCITERKLTNGTLYDLSVEVERA